HATARLTLARGGREHLRAPGTEDQRGAALGKIERHLPADPGGGAGHDHDSASIVHAGHVQSAAADVNAQLTTHEIGEGESPSCLPSAHPAVHGNCPKRFEATMVWPNRQAAANGEPLARRWARRIP